MGRKIGICIPALDHVDFGFCHDLTAAVGYHAGTFDDDSLDLHYHQGALIQESRNILARRAVEAGNDYVIFLDTDMRFPQDTFDRLMNWDEPVVAANCAKRRRPIAPTARIIDGDDPSDDRPVWPEQGEDGLQRVDVVGTAVMCIEADVFMQLEYPWFDVRYLPARDWFVGEDLYFCAQLREAGIPLYIDHGLSWAVGHIGQYEYGMNDCLGERELARTGYWADRMKEDGPEVEVVAG